MKKRIHRVSTLAAFLAVAIVFAASVAGATELSTVVKDLQDKYRRITTIEADFRQEFRSAMGGTQTSTGKVYLKKPGKMRWDYKDPVKDEIVSDGKTVWVYQPDLNQVILRPVDSAAPSIATDFLSGIGDLEKDFHIKLASETTEAWTLELTPRSAQPNLRRLLLDVDKKSTLAVRTVVVDHFGNETSVRFNDIKLNYAVTDLLFEFVPPAGASVIRP